MIIFMLILATFGLSSMWLYSPGPKPLRKWWIANTGKFAPLAYCQLCSAFWIGLLLHAVFAGPSPALAWALGYAGAAWILGAMANCFLWGKAWFEKEHNRD
jgi:hypothetical protein